MIKSLNKIRLGIVGLGGMGSHYGGLLQKGDIHGIELAAVCDIRPPGAGQFTGFSYFSEAEQMYASGEIDAVIIATPHFSHSPLGVAALKAGLHVMVEKPISVDKLDAEKLAAEAAKTDQVCATMFVMRTYPMFRRLKELIDECELGTIQRIHWTVTNWFRTQAYYDSGSWRGTWEGEGGGVLMNQCPHQLDLWQWLFGMPVRVQAICGFGRYHDIEVEDEVTAILEYADGKAGVFVASTGEFPGTNRLEIAGDLGQVVVNLSKGDTIRFTRNEVSISEFSRSSSERSGGPAVSHIEIPIPPQQGDPYVEMLNNFGAAIRKEIPLIAPAIEGVHSVELGNAMLLSALRREVISLPMDGVAFKRELSLLIEESRKRKKQER